MKRQKMKTLVGGLALALAAISCQQNNVLPLAPEKSTKTVTVEIDAPRVEMQQMKNAPTSKNKEHDLRFVLEVWESIPSETKRFISRIEQLANADGKTAAFTFEVEEGDYQLLFWADYIESGTVPTEEKYPELYYSTSLSSGEEYMGLKAITLKEENFNLNNEKRDAFYGSASITKEAQPLQLPKQTLKRALSKLSIFEKNKLAILNTQSVSVEYQVPNMFNVSSKSTGNSKFAVNLSHVQVTSAADAETPQIIFFDYILSSANGETMGEIKLSGKSVSDEEMNTYVIPAHVPLKQNARTNLFGLILEEAAPVEPGKDVQVDLEVEEGWESPDSDIEDWEGKLFDGEGTAENPYQIASKEKLKKLAEVFNEGQVAYRGLHFELTADIELTNGDNNDKISIGNSRENHFEGSFHGNGFAIINQNGCTNSASEASGLFGFVKNSAINQLKVKNLKTISSAHIVGGLVGVVLQGEQPTTISNCQVEVLQITGNAPKDAGEETGASCIGGICALVEGNLTISACKLASISNNGLKSNIALTKHIGGIVGSIAPEATVQIEACYNENKLQAPASVNADEQYHVGGICGYNEGTLTITNSYNIGAVQLANKSTIEEFSNVTLGQLLGELDDAQAAIADCYFSGKVENIIGTNNAAIRFGVDKWPTWESPWGKLGAYNDDSALIIYPKLSWE